MASFAWVVLSGVLFGSQFVASKYCPDFDRAAYNLTMGLGILLGSALCFAAFGGGLLPPGVAGFAALSGAVWVAGNFLLIRAVADAGMARSFTVVNLTAVLSFIGGAAVLGELGGRSGAQVAAMAGALGLVVAGSALVGATSGGGGGGKGPADVRRGVAFAFLSTLFFAAYNVLVAVIINRMEVPPPTAFFHVSPGIVLGALLIASAAPNGALGKWTAAPLRWQGLALVQGLVWAAAMASIMVGWRGTGIAAGTPVQMGTQTVVSALWGMLFFGEFRDVPDRRAALGRFGAGAAAAVLGTCLMALV